MDMYGYKGTLVHFDGKPLVFADMKIYPDSYFTINTYDGNNVCVHNGLGSWRDAGSENPVLEKVVGSYFWKKFCRRDILSFGFVKKWIYLLLPMWMVVLISRHASKIKNNKRVGRIKLGR